MSHLHLHTGLIMWSEQAEYSSKIMWFFFYKSQAIFFLNQAKFSLPFEISMYRGKLSWPNKTQTKPDFDFFIWSSIKTNSELQHVF